MLSPTTKSQLLFLFCCIPTRILFVFLASGLLISRDYLPYFALLILPFIIMTSLIYLFQYRKSGWETFGEPIWWDSLRPVHASLYFLFFLLALRKSKYSWLPLLLDVMLGSVAFLIHHYIN